VRVNSYCEIDESILLPRAMIGRYSRVRRAIIDEGVVLPENSRVGFDAEEDRALGRVVTESGITVVPSPVPHQQTFRTYTAARAR
jgi:glucose-1-phosphate adenylyltransferase